MCISLFSPKGCARFFINVRDQLGERGFRRNCCVEVVCDNRIVRTAIYLECAVITAERSFRSLCCVFGEHGVFVFCGTAKSAPPFVLCSGLLVKGCLGGTAVAI